MSKRCSIGFPVLAVEGVDGHIQIHPILEAAIGHSKSVRIGAWNVERLDTAMLTECVLRAASIEGIGCQMLLTGDQSKPTGWHDNVDIAAHRTD